MKLFKYLSIGVLLTLSGEYLAYYVYTSIDQGGFLLGFLGVLAFVLICLGVVALLYYPLSKADQWDAYLLTQSKAIRALGITISIVLLALPFVAAIFTFYHFTGEYHKEQIAKYGVVQKVYLDKEIRGRSGRHDLCFEFTHNDKEWKGMLDHWQYEVGDSAEIIYSSQNPNEVEWFEKYTREIEQR